MKLKKKTKKRMKNKKLVTKSSQTTGQKSRMIQIRSLVSLKTEPNKFTIESQPHMTVTYLQTTISNTYKTKSQILILGGSSGPIISRL